MRTLLRVLFPLLVLSAWGQISLAQSIPDNIPDIPGESPADRTRERLTERYRAQISRIFLASHIAMGPIAKTDGLLVDLTIQGGVDLRGGGALHVAAGSRSASMTHQKAGPFTQPYRHTAYLVFVGYDVPLQRLLPGWKGSRRGALAVGMGGVFAESGAATLEIGPKYVLPLNRYWSVPLGIKVNTEVLGNGTAHLQRTFVGMSVGAKVRFAHRKRLK